MDVQEQPGSILVAVAALVAEIWKCSPMTSVDLPTGSS